MRYLRHIILTLCALALMLPSAVRAAGGPQVRVTQVDNSKYPNVTVYVSVKDAVGQAITGLKQNEFSLTEDGTPVQIVDFRGGELVAISTVLVIDCSNSMNMDGKLDGAKQAALTFVDLLRSQDQAAVVMFRDTVSVAQPFTADPTTLKRAIENLGADGNTAWRDGLYMAVEMLQTAKGRRSIILLTDGMDNRSGNSQEQVIAFARRASVPAYAIGLGSRSSWLQVVGGGIDEDSLKQVAQQTEGKYYYTPSADELRALYASLAKGMQQEYALTYYSPRPTFDGTRRNIIVQVGGTSGGSAYLEKHLLNVHSDPLVGGVCLLPLLLALLVPAGVLALRRRQATVAPPASLQPPVWTPPPVASPPTWTPPPTVPRPDWTPPAPPARPPAASVCVKCGEPLRAGAKFCAKCGAIQNTPSGVKLAAANCPRCGNPVNPGAKFCNRCGVKL